MDQGRVEAGPLEEVRYERPEQCGRAVGNGSVLLQLNVVNLWRAGAVLVVLLKAPPSPSFLCRFHP